MDKLLKVLTIVFIVAAVFSLFTGVMDAIHRGSKILELESAVQASSLVEEQLLEKLGLYEKQIREYEDVINGYDSLKGVEVVDALVTSYAPLDPNAVDGMCYEGDPSVTSTGSKVRMGVAAADPKKLPYGTIIEVPGYGLAIVEDTGGAMRSASGIHIDVFLPTRAEAYSWGRKNLEVKIIRFGKGE